MGFISLSKKLGATVVTAAVLMMAKEAMGQSGTYEGFQWQAVGGVAKIVGYTGIGGNITVPSVVVEQAYPVNRNYTVTAVEEGAFNRNDFVISVVVPSSVTRIGVYAFGRCSNLEFVEIQGDIESIEERAFVLCPKLRSVTFPPTVSSIGPSAFNDCAALESVSSCSSVTEIGDYAFQNCLSLSSVAIPNVTHIGYRAFARCSNLQSISIPAGITSIETSTFTGCTSLSSVSLPSGLRTIGEYAFFECSSLRNISIPLGTEYIGAGAFGSCNSLAKVDLPNTITNIESGAFSECSALQAITLPDSLTSIQRSTFYKCNNLKTVIIPEGIQDIGNSAFMYCSSLQSIAFPSTFLGTGDSAFMYCSSLQSITFPSAIWVLGNYSFVGCSNLTKVCFEGRMPNAGSAIFAYAPVSQIFYQTGTSGWGSTFAGLPTVECNQCVGLVTDVTPPEPVTIPPLEPANGVTNLILLMHGWAPLLSRSPVSEKALMPILGDAIQKRLVTDGIADQWRIRVYDWSDKSQRLTPQWATRNAIRVGERVFPEIVDAGYKKVHLIAHSAGSWVVHQLGKELEQNDVTVCATFLDAYTPNKKNKRNKKFYTPERLADGISMAEHYYYGDTLLPGLGNPLTHAVDHDITALKKCEEDRGDPHGWPARWYGLTASVPNYPFARGLGYQVAFNFTPPDTVEPPCSESELQAAASQAASLAQAASLTTARRRTISVATPPPPLPPELDLAALIRFRQRAMELRAARTNLASEYSLLNNAESQNTTSEETNIVLGSEVTTMANLTFLSQESSFDFASFQGVASGGSGSIATNAQGIELLTTNFLWGTFSFNATNAFNFGALSYTLGNNSNSIVGIWIDGEPATMVQNAPQDDLETIEPFPLSKVLGSGNHLVTVSLESLDRTPIAATFEQLEVSLSLEPPVLTIKPSTNALVELTWEAGAGLKYQAQYNDALTSTNWTNFGGLRTSPTNAVMSAFDALNSNQRYYRLNMSVE